MTPQDEKIQRDTQKQVDSAPLPWENDRLTLWSLLAMILADTRDALDAICAMNDLRLSVKQHQEMTDIAAWPSDSLEAEMGLLIHSSKRATESLSLDKTLETVRYLDQTYTTGHPRRNSVEMLIDLDHLQQAFVSEMGAILFLYLPPNRLQFYVGDDATAAPFGSQVFDAFPSAAADVREASNAYALERWPACVFHLMRVLEFGLNALARRFDVSVERSTWHEIIERIEPKIRKIAPSAGADWKQQQKDFSDAATQFMFFKDAWRNHIMHVRDMYDEGRTMSIWQHVNEFMNKLAAIGLREKTI